MSTTPSTPTPSATSTATSVSVLQKIENWFKKAKVKLEDGLAKILGPTLAGDVESAFGEILSTAEGKLALTVVTEAADAVSGQIDVSAAVKATVAAVAQTGKQISQSTATALVAAAQQKVASLVQSSQG